MNLTRLVFLFIVGGAFADDGVNKDSGDTPGYELVAEHGSLVIRPQTPAEAYEYLLSTLDQMSFFEANSYNVALPNHPDFRKPGETGSFQQFIKEVYREQDFQPALSLLADSKPALQAALNWFSRHKHGANLYVPEQYTVVLTLYGPGGSYDPASGTITLFTTPDGRFKGGGATHTIVHEMMHVAVEKSLVKQFSLSHWEKERVVDLLTQRELGHLLPGYQLQSQGVAEIGEAVAGVPISGLADAIKAYRRGFSL